MPSKKKVIFIKIKNIFYSYNWQMICWVIIREIINGDSSAN